MSHNAEHSRCISAGGFRVTRDILRRIIFKTDLKEIRCECVELIQLFDDKAHNRDRVTRLLKQKEYFATEPLATFQKDELETFTLQEFSILWELNF